SGGSGDQGFGNSRSHRAQGSRSGGAESMKGVNNAPHRAEQADERRDGSGSGKQWQAAFHARQLLRRGYLHRTLNRVDIAHDPGRPAGLAAILLVSALKHGHQRAGPELIGDRGDVTEPRRLAKGADETAALRAGSTEARPFRENDRPREKTEDE